MLGFFKIIDPFRMLFLLLLLIGIKLPGMLWGYPLTIPELNLMVIGDKVGGSVVMYRDVWDSTAPLSALAFRIFSFLFGQNQLGYQVVAIILIYIQALYLNNIFNRNNVFKEKTLFPALFYICYSVLFFDYATLSPVLLGTTLLIIALHLILTQMRLDQTQDKHYYIGLLIGAAGLFYIPLSIFIIFAFLCLGLYSPLNIRKGFQLVSGFLIPFLAVIAYFYLFNGASMLYSCLLEPLAQGFSAAFIDWQTLIIPSMMPLGVFLLAQLLIFSASGLVNFQYRCIRVLVLWMLTSIGVLFLSYQFFPALTWPLLIPLSFFTTHLFQLIRRPILADSFFLTVLVVYFVICFKEIHTVTHQPDTPYLSSYIIDKKAYAAYRDKKVVVFGDRPDAYYGNSLATPYYNVSIAKHFDLSNLKDYKNIGHIFERFEEDKPEVIVDPMHLMGEIMHSIPNYRKEYMEDSADVFILRKDLLREK